MKPYKFFFAVFCSAVFCVQGTSQQNFTKLIGGMEGASGTMINNAIGRSTSWWSVSNTTTQLSEETGIVRSGRRSLKVSTTSTTPRRAYLPSMPGAPPTKVVVQYYRLVTSLVNSVESLAQVSPDGGLGNIQNSGASSLPASVNTWEKVKFITAVQVTPNVAWAAILEDAVGSGGDLYIDDAAIYTADGASNDEEDVTPPNPVTGSITVTKGTYSPSLTLSWNPQNYDGGGYLLVRYTQDPGVVIPSVPNPNGIYGMNSIIVGANPGTVVSYDPTPNYQDEGVEPGTQYWYRVYVYDKAYNYSTALQTGPVQSIGDTYFAADMNTANPWHVNDYTTWQNKQGQLPAPFTTDPYPAFTYFKILRDGDVNGNWKINSTSPNYSTSKVIVGDGVNPVSLTILSSGSVTTDKSDLFEISNNASVIIKSAAFPKGFQPSSVNSLATIVYEGTDQVVGNVLHPNVIFKSSGIKTAGTVTINGDCKILENATFKLTGSLTLNKNFEIASTATFDPGPSTLTAFFKSVGTNHIVTASNLVKFNNVGIQNNGTVLLNANAEIAKTLTVNSGSILGIGSNKTLTLNGTFQGFPSNATTQKLAGSKTGNLLLGSGYSGGLYFTNTASFPEGDYLNSLVKSATADVALQTPLNIVPSDPLIPNSGFIEIEAGRLAVQGAGKLNLLSDDKGSARIARTSSSFNPYLTGNITVNRFIPGKRAWRMLTSPVAPAGNNTINAVWQKGYISNGPSTYNALDAMNGDFSSPLPATSIPAGVGTHITGGTGANFYNKPGVAMGLGYDVGVTAAGATASIRIFDPIRNKWVSFADAGLPDDGPGTISIDQYPAYLLFVRGDRNVLLLQGTAAPDNNTQLETIGVAGQGTKNGVRLSYSSEFPFAIVGNPYPSPINAQKVLADNSSVLKDYCYVWDSRLNNYGGYKVIYDGVNLPLDIGGPTILPASDHIQTAQGFLVVLKNPTIPNQTITITEAHKSDNTSTTEFGARGVPLMYVSLYKTIASESTLTDGVLARFGESYSPGFDNGDILKASNLYENLSIVRGGKSLMLESRPAIDKADTVYLQLTGTSVQAYQFKILGSNFKDHSVSAFIYDSYLKKETLINLDSTTTIINFNIFSEAASRNTDRFKIIFRANRVLPLDFTAIKAYRKEKDIAVEWTIAQETNVDHYDIEKSAEGTQFLKAASVTAVGNRAASLTYNWLDNNPLEGFNYYRIRSVDKTGDDKLSKVVLVNIIKPGEEGFSIYPNPIVDNKISVDLKNVFKGNYQLTLYNSAGQQVFSQAIVHEGGSASKTIILPGNLSKGVYQVKLAGGNYKVIQIALQ